MDVNIGDEYLQQSILPSSSGSVSSNAAILIPRSSCEDISHLCVEVLPGYNSTYSLADGFSHVQCLDITPYKNCIGMYAIALLFKRLCKW